MDDKSEQQASLGRNPQQQQRPRPFKSFFLSFVSALTLVLFLRGNPLHLFWSSPAKHDALTAPSAPFDWATLPTKPQLQYAKCYGGKFQCARLELPMDYWNGTTNATISLAIARLPAVVPVTDPQYGGAILLNPGGPGGSGVGFLSRAGDAIRSIVDAKTAHGKFYDLISFDPRGIALSTPNVRCLDSALTEQTWQLRLGEEGLFDASDAASGRVWSMMHATAGGCSILNSHGKPDIKQYVTTSSVARDMLEIVEQHGVWREAQAKRLLAQTCSSRHTKAAVVVPDPLQHKPGKEKILYWGFSYGTYLGNTFAAMFPDRIHRLIVDGVVDADDYRTSLWSDNLLDAEKGLDLLYYHCARVGYPACALASPKHKSTPAELKKRSELIIQNLLHNPLAIVGKHPEVITYSDVRAIMFSALYSPIAAFPGIARMLALIEKGDVEELAPAFRAIHTVDCSRSLEDVPTPDGRMAIACTDGDDITSRNKTVFAEFTKNITRQSPSAGPLWAMDQLQCIHYSVRPYTRFVAPWKAKTSHPLLLIGNTADPVTPGAYARKMAKGFAGAVALIQDSGGHCSISAFSNCTTTFVRDYFQTGNLPKANTTCPADALPFGSGDKGEVGLFATEQRRHAQISQALADSGALPLQRLHSSFAQLFSKE